MSSLRSLSIATCLVAVCAWLAGPAEGALVSYYTFDGSNAIDSSGNGNNGTLLGGTLPTFSGDVAPQIGGGLSLSLNNAGITSNGSRVEVAHSASLAINDAITISYWLRADAADQPNTFTRTIGKNGGSTSDPGWEYQRDGGGSTMRVRTDTNAGGNKLNGTVAAFDGDWHHIAHVLDNGSMKAYFDGVEVDSDTYPHGTGFGNTRKLTIGTQNGGGRPLNGLMDDVSIWDNTLNASEISFLASGGSASQLANSVMSSFAPNADAHVQGFGTAAETSNFGTSTLLQVKNQADDAGEFNRKGYIRFDVSGVDKDRLVSGEFSVSIPDPASGAGSDAGTNWTFNVFGLNDGVGEDWDELGITWDNAPANIDDGSLMGSGATLLGQLDPTITGRGDGEVLTLNSLALREFLLADSDGLVTFIVTRVEGESSGNTVVHAFASRENSDESLHPSLKLTLTPIPEPSTALLGMFGLAGLLKRRRSAA